MLTHHYARCFGLRLGGHIDASLEQDCFRLSAFGFRLSAFGFRLSAFGLAAEFFFSTATCSGRDLAAMLATHVLIFS